MIQAEERMDQGLSGSAPARQIAWVQVEDYLYSLATKGCTEETVKTYQHSLREFFRVLPEGGWIDQATVARWRDSMVEQGYMPRTVNLRLSPVNGLLGFLGLREYQLPGQLQPIEGDAQPELTRNEYLRLLSTARMLGKERAYLLVKVFACTGLSVQDLPLLTAEAVHEGEVAIPLGGRRTLAACLRRELLDYLGRMGISAGAVFVSRRGRRLNRTAVTSTIQGLAQEAQIPPEKCNPRCLRRLYQTTRENIRDSLTPLAEQAYQRLLEQEQLTVGWEEAGGSARPELP